MAEARIEIRVDCYAGYRGEETPRRIRLGDRVIEVTDILDRWLAPAHRYFKVIGNDDNLYLIRHDVDADTWELILFEQAQSDMP